MSQCNLCSLRNLRKREAEKGNAATTVLIDGWHVVYIHPKAVRLPSCPTKSVIRYIDAKYMAGVSYMSIGQTCEC